MSVETWRSERAGAIRPRVGWQEVVVALVVLGAVVYLASRFVPARLRPRSNKPDVPVGSLVRGKRRASVRADDPRVEPPA